MKKVSYAKSVFTGIFVGVLLYLFAWLPFTLVLSFWLANLVVAVLVVAVPLWGIYLEGEDKMTSAIMLVLFVVSASLVSWPLMDMKLVPVEHKAPMYNLKTEYRVVFVPGAKIEWGFYEPNCYTTSNIDANMSIAVADYYYRGFLTFNPYYSVPQAVSNKLTCGYATSIGAYGGYKEELESQGFKIKEDFFSFTATNNTTAVYCYLDDFNGIGFLGKHIVVAKASKDNRYLLNQIMDR